MDTYLISIQKQHNENIFTGKKRFEGRKKIPKTIEIKNYLDNTMTYTPQSTDTKFVVYEPKNGGGCGKVIGEFICDYAQSFRRQVADFKLIAKALCVSIEFAKQYFDKDIGYMMRICEPKLYDKPRELGEFRKPCGNCIGKCTGEHYDRCPWQTITRPLQSYMRIQDTEEV